MPYICVKQGEKWVLMKKDGSGNALGHHDSRKSCINQMRAVYSHEADNPKNIFIDGPIFGPPFDFESKIQESKDFINVIINSEGGDYFTALMMHNKLRGSKKHITCYIQSTALSAAAVIALAGDTIYMAENALMMFHPTKYVPREAMDSDEMKNLAEALDKTTTTLVNTLMSKTGMKEHEARKLVEEETWLTAEEAQSLGIVDEIIPIMRDVKVENYFPERIVNFVQEKQEMPLKELCDKFGVADEAGLESFITNLQANQSKPPMEVPTNIVNMVKKSREIELNDLVGKGIQTPAVVNELKIKFLSDDRIISDTRTGNEDFDSVMSALRKGEKIVNFEGSSGTQPLPKGDASDDLLVKNMEARKEGKK